MALCRRGLFGIQIQNRYLIEWIENGADILLSDSNPECVKAFTGVLTPLKSNMKHKQQLKEVILMKVTATREKVCESMQLFYILTSSLRTHLEASYSLLAVWE